MHITGSWVAIPTPFKDKTINFDAFEMLIDFHACHRTDGLLVLGSAGEASMLSTAEKQKIITAVSEYARKKIPVLVGTTGCNTAESIALTTYAYECGAYGALLVVPGYIRPPQEAIYEFFETVASSADIPVAIYNNPTRVGVNIAPETAIRLAKIPNIVALKEAVPNVNQLVEVKKAVGDNLDILTCDSPVFSIILPNLAIGGAGVTSITGNLAPEEFAELSQPWTAFEDVVRSRNLIFRYYELMQICYSVTNPVVIKAGLNLLGLDVGSPRPPLQELTEERKHELETTMKKLGLFDKYKR
jgi:4-hydroxy-tetrahydrodipicolinate synthase